MKRMFVIAAALVLSAPLSAFAQDQQRLTNTQYIGASRCVALASLPQLQSDGYNVTALDSAIHHFNASPVASDVAHSEKQDIRHDGIRAGDNARLISDLRDRRNTACANFVQTGLVQAGGTSQPS